jgi:putative hydrolase of the HAD superfamily
LVSQLPFAILFDLDDTILSFGRRRLLLQEVAEGFSEHLHPCTATAAADLVDARFAEFWSDEARHRQWRQRLAEARRLVVERTFAELRKAGADGLHPELAQAFSDRFHAHREAQARCFPGALDALAELRRRSVRLALVTNGSRDAQRAKIARFDLAGYFDHIQIEGEHGFGKPEERAYRHALEALGSAAGETWMVGDNLEWEVAAPQRLGIFGIWHDHLGEGLPAGSTVVPDRIIRSLPELLD